MTAFSKKISIRWADIDANFHLRHSVFYDFGAQHRIEILEQRGLTMQLMNEQHFGPVLFREECLFKREIHLVDIITINASLLKMRADGSRFSIQHAFTNEQQQLCALLTIDGAWMNTKLRRLLKQMPPIITDVMNSFPKAKNFEEV